MTTHPPPSVARECGDIYTTLEEVNVYEEKFKQERLRSEACERKLKLLQKKLKELNSEKESLSSAHNKENRADNCQLIREFDTRIKTLNETIVTLSLSLLSAKKSRLHQKMKLLEELDKLGDKSEKIISAVQRDAESGTASGGEMGNELKNLEQELERRDKEFQELQEMALMELEPMIKQYEKLLEIEEKHEESKLMSNSHASLGEPIVRAAS